MAASGAEPPQPATAVGEAVSREDLTWREAAAELAPAKSLARVEDRAKQVVSTVSLVGTLLAGLGLVAGDQLTDPGSGLARRLGLAAAGAAVVAVVLAVGWSLLRISRGVAPGNLVAVRDWYGRQFRRAYLVVAAGVLLLVAVVLAGIAGMLAITVGPGRADQPVLSLAVTGSEAGSGTGSGVDLEANAAVRVHGVLAGRLVRVEVVGMGAQGQGSIVLARAVTSADGDGTASVSLDAVKLAGVQLVELVAHLPGRTCTMALSIGAAVAPNGAPDRVSCSSP